MIESYYWKEELKRIAHLIRPVANPRRWTERSHCIVERDIMIGFFIVRRMIEMHKLTSKTKDFCMEVYASPRRGKKVTFMNHHRLDELYEMDKERKKTKKPFYMSNQFIHAYTSFVARDETRNWNCVERNNCIWRVPIAGIRDLFILASEDYLSSMTSTFNTETGDYDVVTS
jgi:hypothetical protein